MAKQRPGPRLHNETILSVQKGEMMDTEFDEDGNVVLSHRESVVQSQSARTNRQGTSVQEGLYNLASQRTQKLNERAEKLAKDEQVKLQKERQKNQNKASNQHTSQKFCREFFEVLKNMEEQEDEWDQTQMISFQQTGSLLATLGFLPANVQPDDNDYKLFEEVW